MIANEDEIKLILHKLNKILNEAKRLSYSLSTILDLYDIIYRLNELRRHVCVNYIPTEYSIKVVKKG